MDMDALQMWVWPTLGVVFLICAISVYATRQIGHMEKRRVDGHDTPIPQEVKEHPFSMNPIFWAFLAAFIFMAIVISYYASSSPG